MACPCLGAAGFACASMLAGFNPVSGRDLCFVALWCKAQVLDGCMQLKLVLLLHTSRGFSLDPHL